MFVDLPPRHPAVALMASGNRLHESVEVETDTFCTSHPPAIGALRTHDHECPLTVGLHVQLSSFNMTRLFLILVGVDGKTWNKVMIPLKTILSCLHLDLGDWLRLSTCNTINHDCSHISSFIIHVLIGLVIFVS
jgi:hypothetical protein